MPIFTFERNILSSAVAFIEAESSEEAAQKYVDAKNGDLLQWYVPKSEDLSLWESGDWGGDERFHDEDDNIYSTWEGGSFIEKEAHQISKKEYLETYGYVPLPLSMEKPDKKTYTIRTTVYTYYEIGIEADSEKAALEMAKGKDIRQWVRQGEGQADIKIDRG